MYPRGAQTITLKDDFEDGLDSWTTDAEVPENPNNPGQNVTWTIGLTPYENSNSENHSVLFAIDGGQGDGAIWIERKLSLQPYDAVKNISVTFRLWSEDESFNTIAAVIGYVGNRNPSSEDYFHVLGVANQVAGWKTYTFNSEVTVDSDLNAYVALGIAVRWETTMEYYVDDVEIVVM